MDRLIDAILDPKVILAGIVGWTVRGLIVEKQAPQLANRSPKQMAGTLVHRQAGVAKEHAIKRVSALADDRTRQLVDSFLPRARTKEEQRVVHLTIPK